MNEYKFKENEERELFFFLSASLRDSQEKERVRVERIKYLQFGLSIACTVLGVLSTSLYSYLRNSKIQEILTYEKSEFTNTNNAIEEVLRKQIQLQTLMNEQFNHLNEKQNINSIPQTDQLTYDQIKEIIRNEFLATIPVTVVKSIQEEFAKNAAEQIIFQQSQNKNIDLTQNESAAILDHSVSQQQIVDTIVLNETEIEPIVVPTNDTIDHQIEDKILGEESKLSEFSPILIVPIITTQSKDNTEVVSQSESIEITNDQKIEDKFVIPNEIPIEPITTHTNDSVDRQVELSESIPICIETSIEQQSEDKHVISTQYEPEEIPNDQIVEIVLSDKTEINSVANEVIIEQQIEQDMVEKEPILSEFIPISNENIIDQQLEENDVLDVPEMNMAESLPEKEITFEQLKSSVKKESVIQFKEISDRFKDNALNVFQNNSKNIAIVFSVFLGGILIYTFNK